MHVLYTSPDWGGPSVYDVSELYGEQGRFRTLGFADGAVQGAIDLNDPQRIVLEYPRALIHLMEENGPGFRRAFLIGHGAGTIPSRYEASRFRVAEISGEVIALSRRWFGYPHDNVVQGDGRGLLEQEPDGSLDFILLDAFTASGTPTHLLSRTFFALTGSKLTQEGALLLNLAAKGREDRRLNAVYATLARIYPHISAFELKGGGVHDLRNVVLIAGQKPAAYKLRRMAGFRRRRLDHGYIIEDS